MNDSDPSIATMLEAAREDLPSFEDRQRVKRALLARLGAGAVAASASTAAATASALSGSTAGAAAATASAKLGVNAILISLVVSSVVAGASAVAVRRHASNPAKSAAAAKGAPAAIAPRAAIGPHVDRLRVAEIESVPNPPASVSAPPPPVAATPVHFGTVPSSHPAALESELPLLQGAQAALQSGNPGRALALLDEHAHRFPNGMLTEERRALRIATRCHTDPSADARAEATAFLQNAPASPLAERVQRACLPNVSEGHESATENDDPGHPSAERLTE